jgi:hypothetical protein
MVITYYNFAGLVKKHNKTPINPAKFVWTGPATPDDTDHPPKSLKGLRDPSAELNYQWFCEHFIECVIPSTDWKLKSRNQVLSKYVTPTLEAFAVVVYCNAFDVWNQRWKVEPTDGTIRSEDTDDVSTLSGATPTRGVFKFTAESKGSRKYEGWNSAGMDFYNDLLTLVEHQRGHPGCTFEHDLMHALASKPKAGRANASESQPPRARNHLGALMQIVGV